MVDNKENAEIKSTGFTLEEYLRIFLRYKKSILITTGIVFISSIILYFFIFKPVYWSTATIKTSNNSAGGISNLLGSDMIPDIGGLGDLAGGGATGKELALYETIILSRRCIEETIIKFNLMEVYKQQYFKWAVKYFREEILTIKVDKVSGTIDIGVYDEDPQRAKEIADFLLYELNKINIELNVLDAKNNREFLEARYDLVKKDLKKSEDSLEVFQTVYGISPDLTVQASLKAQIEIESLIASEEVKLDLLKKILSPSQPEIKAQEEKIAALNNQLNQIVNSSGNENNIIGLEGKPEVVMNFLRLKRDVEIQNKILGIILPLYEQAKIEENRETPSILIIDPPNIPDYKEKPKRAKGVLLMTFGAFIFINFIVILKYKWIIYRNNSNLFKKS